MKGKVGIILMTFGAMLVAAALSLAVYNIYTDKQAEKNSSTVLVKLEEEITQRSDENISSDFIDNSQNQDEVGDMETISINGKNYIGIIDIPTIGIKLPVLSEWNYDNLDIAPCRYSGSIDKGLILAAHNFTGHFGKLKNLILDDEVYFIDANGKIHNYYVDYIDTIDGNQADKMLAGDWDLTMFTCTFDGTERVTIRCRKV